MGQYDDYLVGGGALRKVIEKVHTDQERQDTFAQGLSDSMPTGLDVAEISELWNNV